MLGPGLVVGGPDAWPRGWWLVLVARAGAWCLVPGAWCLVPGLVPRGWWLVPGAWWLVACAWCLLLGGLWPCLVAGGCWQVSCCLEVVSARTTLGEVGGS